MTRYLRSPALVAILAVFILSACGGPATSGSPAASDEPSEPASQAAETDAPDTSGSPDASDEPTALDPDGDPVTLRLLSSWAEGSVFSGPAERFVEEVEDRSGGRVTIEYDGPDVVPFTEGMTALANGVYDIHYNVPLYHTGIVAAGEAIYFISGESSCQEYRDAGALDIYDQIHRETAGVMFLGCGGGGAHGATFLLKEPISTVDELSGLTFRGFGLYTRVLDELGANSVAMPPGDIYGAIERGVIDGAAFPNLGILEFGLHEVAPYIVMPPYLPFRYGFYANPASFEGLPQDVQTFLLETLWDLEEEFDQYYVEQRDAEAVQLEEAGVEEVRLSDAESDRLGTIIRDELWAFIEESHPDLGPQLREAFEAVEGS